MGYMGFGMKKEVYTRKPKKAFKKVKKFILPKTQAGNGDGYKASRAYEKIRFKPAYQRPWFWVLAISTLGVLTYVYLDRTVFEKRRQKAATIEFETKGIKGYYQTHQKTIDSIAHYVKTRNGKIASIGRNSFRDFWITIRSEDYRSALKSEKKNHRSHSLHNTFLQPEVIQGKLKHHINNMQGVYTDYWTCSLELKYIRGINTTFIKHLKTDYQELGDIISKVAKNDFIVNESKYGMVLEFDHLENTYAFFFSSLPDSLAGTEYAPPTRIAHDLYWTKRLTAHYYW